MVDETYKEWTLFCPIIYWFYCSEQEIQLDFEVQLKPNFKHVQCSFRPAHQSLTSYTLIPSIEHPWCVQQKQLGLCFVANIPTRLVEVTVTWYVVTNYSTSQHYSAIIISVFELPFPILLEYARCKCRSMNVWNRIPFRLSRAMWSSHTLEFTLDSTLNYRLQFQ